MEIAGVVYEPVAGGLLTGAVTLETDVSAQKEWPSVYDRIFAPGRLERSLAVADCLRVLAADWGYEMSQLAIAWCLHQDGVSSALAGTTSTTHALTNAHAAEIVLTPAQLARLDEAIPLGPSFA